MFGLLSAPYRTHDSTVLSHVMEETNTDGIHATLATSGSIKERPFVDFDHIPLAGIELHTASGDMMRRYVEVHR